MLICRRINLLDKVEVILVLWKGGGWMALEADVSFSRHGVVGRMIGLDDLRGLFQPMVL